MEFKMFLIVWITFMGLTHCHGAGSSISLQGGVKRIPGDIMLGATLPIHKFVVIAVPYTYCPRAINMDGIQELEAILFALDTISKDPDLLPGVCLGLDIMDTCKLYLQIITYFREHGVWASEKPSLHVTNDTDVMVAFIDGGPTPTLEVLSILNAEDHELQIPQISYASTANGLSDKTKFAYFSRVVSPDDYQANVMVDVVTAFNWTYVSMVFDEGADYGEAGVKMFKTKASEKGIGVAMALAIPAEAVPDRFHTIIKDLLENTKAKVVVLFAKEENCRHLVSAAADMGVSDKLQWLASDRWGTETRPVQHQERAAEGAITVRPRRDVVQGFNEYFLSLNPRENTRNPWFKDFWEEQFQCSFDPLASTVCSGYEVLRPPFYQQEGLVSAVVDSVYVIAHALNNMMKDTCPGSTLCEAMDPPKGDVLLQYIRNVNFTGVTGSTIGFDKNGDSIERYQVYQYQKLPNGLYEYVLIGNWSDELSMDYNNTDWTTFGGVLPRSVCSEPCPSGHRKQHDEALDKGCWICIACEAHMVLRNESTCEACPNGSYPDATQSYCYKLDVEYMTISSVWAIVPVVVASLGVLCTLFVAAIFIRFNSTPLIMASGRELCYVLMVGQLMCYAMTLIMVLKPSTATCALMRIGLGLSLSIIYAALFTKTNRISRIFNRGTKSLAQRPNFTSPRSQLVICFCLVSVQILVVFIWFGLEIPDTTLSYPDRKTVVLRCKSSNVAIVLSLLYNMILIILCTIYAFKTRKIPENFNEAKHIAFTMYSTCIVWLAFIPIYFGTQSSDFRIQITALCMCVSISATVALCCLFVPKVYIVLFQPHKNVRQSSKNTSQSGTGRTFLARPSSGYNSPAVNGDTTPSPGMALLPPKSDEWKPEEGNHLDDENADTTKDKDNGSLSSAVPETHV